jgi:hypothetical protein
LTLFHWRPFAIAALLSLSAGCETERAHTPPSGKPATRWHELGVWSGSGNRQTESFEVTTGALRVTWETRNETEPGAGRFRVSLHSAISGRSLQTIVDVRGVGGNAVNLEDDPRTSYLEIQSDSLEWRVRLEEVVVTTAAKP